MWSGELKAGSRHIPSYKDIVIARTHDKLPEVQNFMYTEQGCFLVKRSPFLFHQPETLSTVSPSDRCHGFTAAFSDFAAASHSGLGSWH